MISPKIIAAIVAQAIAARLVRCSVCNLLLTESDEGVVAIVCEDCSELSVMHGNCVEHVLDRREKEFIHAEARLNWRWN